MIVEVSDHILVRCFRCDRDCGQDSELVRIADVQVAVHAGGCSVTAA